MIEEEELFSFILVEFEVLIGSFKWIQAHLQMGKLFGKTASSRERQILVKFRGGVSGKRQMCRMVG